MIFRSAIDAIKRGLAKTAASIGTGVRTLLHGRRLTDEVLDELETRLIAADVGVKAARETVGALRDEFRAGRVEQGEGALDFLKRSLKARLGASSGGIRYAERGPTVVLVVGVNGAGKTTSVAKIAKTIRDSGRTVLLAAADTFRAGAVEQLKTWGARLGVDVVAGSTNADPAAVAFDATDAALKRGVDVLLVDTAGRLHTQEPLMRQLTKVRDVIRKKIPDAPHDVLLVLDATSGQNAIQQAQVFRDAVGVTGLFLAKLDGTARGGVVVAIRDTIDVPVVLVGTGETPDDVQPFDADAFVEAMFAV